MGELLDLGLAMIFFGFDTESKGNKSKNKQVGPHQTKKLLHRKGKNQHSEKVTYGMGVNTCKSYI